MDFIFHSRKNRLIALFLMGLPNFGMTQNMAEGLIYSLPKSEFTITGTVRTTFYTPGPLAAFAKKYLGIQVKEQAETTHQILQTRLILNLLPDTACMFLVPKSAIQPNRFNFGRGAMLLSINSTIPQSNPGGNSKWTSQASGNDLHPLTILSLTQETDTIYRRELLADSVVVEHWEIQTLIQQQTSEEIAKNIAQKLVQLEQDRQQLLRFNEDVQYSGPALKVMLKRLDSLETYYHELFQGRQTHRLTTFSFPLNLTDADLSELELRGNLNKVVAGFSSTTGFSSDTSVSTPMILTIQSAGIQKAMKRFQSEKKAKPNEGILIRMPERCSLQVSLGGTVFIRANYPIFQLGTLIRLPIPKSGVLEYSIWPEISSPDSVEW
jgi:hypothetical protein